MNLSTIRKALIAGAVAGYGAYQTLATTGGASQKAYILAGVIVAVGTAIITYLVPNATDPQAVTLKDVLARLESLVGIPTTARVSVAPAPTTVTSGTAVAMVPVDPPPASASN